MVHHGAEPPAGQRKCALFRASGANQTRSTRQWRAGRVSSADWPGLVGQRGAGAPQATGRPFLGGCRCRREELDAERPAVPSPARQADRSDEGTDAPPPSSIQGMEPQRTKEWPPGKQTWHTAH